VDLVNFEFNGESVAIPAKAAFNVVACHGGIACYDVLNINVINKGSDMS